jgi:hypothetical protein
MVVAAWATRLPTRTTVPGPLSKSSLGTVALSVFKIKASLTDEAVDPS